MNVAPPESAASHTRCASSSPPSIGPRELRPAILPRDAHAGLVPARRRHALGRRDGRRRDAQRLGQHVRVVV
ncbi:MAG TPA: hypothetical protein VF302_09975, partial [Candidatus Limnocylindrales bacterium]